MTERHHFPPQTWKGGDAYQVLAERTERTGRL